MSKASQRRAIKRAKELLDVVVRYIEDNPVSDYTVFYDGAVCDGSCLQEDCKIASAELVYALKELK